LGVLSQTTGIDQVLVTSSDPLALAIAGEADAVAFGESQAIDLNTALSLAAGQAVSWGAKRLLIIAADLPLLTTDDLSLMLAPDDDPGVVIAPDRHEQGTNALLLAPPGTIRPAFGPDSYSAHLLQAKAAGMVPRIVRTPGLGFDLDLPSDYEDLKRLAPEEWGDRTFLAGLSV
jgi:2-phospho-L-lactate guanylyltransferase